MERSMPVPQNFVEAQLESHEIRLQRLESSYADVASQLSAQTVQMDYLSKTVENGLESLGKKLEDIALPLGKRIEALAETLESQGVSVKSLEAAEGVRVKEKQDRQDTRKRWKDKLIIGFCGTAIGVIGTKIGLLIVRLFGG